MSLEDTERAARTELMDQLYQQSLRLHELASNELLLLPEYSFVKTELKSMEGRLMSIQAEIGTLRFNQTPSAV
jgi:hypothetical protein